MGMDDLTIAEISAEISAALRDLSLDEENGIIQEKELLEKEKSFKKAIQDARLKCAPSPSYFVMTVNMNGKGIVQDRRTLLSIIMRNFFASVLFCQELPGKFKEEVVEKCGTGGYDFVCNEKEAAVMWRKEDFDGYPLDTTSKSLMQRLARERRDIETSEMLRRIALAKLQRRKKEGEEGHSHCPPFLAVSWHGPHNKAQNQVTKNKVFAGLICFLCEVCKEKGLSSFIIGGDFNLNTKEISVDLLGKDVFLGDYELTARAQDKVSQNKPGFKYIPYKDNFILYPWKGDIKVSSVRPLEFEDAKASCSDITKNDQEEFDRVRKQAGTSRAVLLDHDPIIGILSLKTVVQTGKFESEKAQFTCTKFDTKCTPKYFVVCHLRIPICFDYTMVWSKQKTILHFTTIFYFNCRHVSGRKRAFVWILLRPF